MGFLHSPFSLLLVLIPMVPRLFFCVCAWFGAPVFHSTLFTYAVECCPSGLLWKGHC